MPLLVNAAGKLCRAVVEKVSCMQKFSSEASQAYPMKQAKAKSILSDLRRTP